MESNQLRFPVLCFYKNTIFTARSNEGLTLTTAAALRGGLFAEMRIIDSTGAEVTVVRAVKDRGVGFLWGYNLFLNQRIRVALEIIPTGKVYSVDEVRSLVLRDFRNWRGWESGGNIDELKSTVETATSVADILSAVAV